MGREFVDGVFVKCFRRSDTQPYRKGDRGNKYPNQCPSFLALFHNTPDWRLSSNGSELYLRVDSWVGLTIVKIYYLEREMSRTSICEQTEYLKAPVPSWVRREILPPPFQLLSAPLVLRSPNWATSPCLISGSIYTNGGIRHNLHCSRIVPV